MTNKVFLKELGIKLKQQRKLLGLKQNELIEKINKGLTKNDDDYLSEKQLSRVECGKSGTRLDKFVRWSLALGKTPDYFLLGIDYSDNSKDGKILQICGCLRNCSDKDIDTVLMLAQGLSSKKNNN